MLHMFPCVELARSTDNSGNGFAPTLNDNRGEAQADRRSHIEPELHPVAAVANVAHLVRASCRGGRTGHCLS